MPRKRIMMADNHTPDQRHYNMSRIRSKENAPETIIRKELFRRGFRYRKNVSNLPGCPDIVLPKYRTVIFINGCFWHKHDCGRFHWPKTNEQYWRAKIQGNVERDQRNYLMLMNLGWKVLVVWECQTQRTVMTNTINNLIAQITGEKS